MGCEVTAISSTPDKEAEARGVRRPPLPRDARAEGPRARRRRASTSSSPPSSSTPDWDGAPRRAPAERRALPGRRHERAPVGPGVRPPRGGRRPSPARRSAAGPRSGRCWPSRRATASRRRRRCGRWPKPTPPSATCGRAGRATGSSSPPDARPARSAGRSEPRTVWPAKALVGLRRRPRSPAPWPGGRSRGRLRGFPRRPRPWRRTGFPPAPRGAGFLGGADRRRGRRRREGRSLAHDSRD